MEIDSGFGTVQALTSGDMRSLRQLTTPDGTPLGAQERDGVVGSEVSAGTQSSWPGLFDWQVADAQNSIRFTDSATTDQAQYSWSSYYPYGQGAVPVTGTAGTLSGGTSIGTGTGANDLLADADALPGGRTYLDKQVQPDRSLGLDHRTYQANLDILTTPDPELDTSNPLAFNPYAYSHNNPVGSSDPSGLAPSCIGQGTCTGTVSPTGGWSNIHSTPTSSTTPGGGSSEGSDGGGSWSDPLDQAMAPLDSAVHKVEQTVVDTSSGFLGGLADQADGISTTMYPRAGPALRHGGFAEPVGVELLRPAVRC